MIYRGPRDFFFTSWIFGGTLVNAVSVNSEQPIVFCRAHTAVVLVRARPCLSKRVVVWGSMKGNHRGDVDSWILVSLELLGPNDGRRAILEESKGQD
jgi:hypothetical protein